MHLSTSASASEASLSSPSPAVVSQSPAALPNAFSCPIVDSCETLLSIYTDLTVSATACTSTTMSSLGIRPIARSDSVDYTESVPPHLRGLDYSRWYCLRECDIWEYGKEELQTLFLRSLQEVGVVECLGLQMKKLGRFHDAIRLGYRGNPYHNFYHAMQVFQGSFLALSKYQCNQWLSYVDQLALLTGALCHDVGHPGVNNQFIKNLRHPLAVYYDDVSVLESYHAAYTFRVLSRYEDMDFRQDMTSEQRSLYHVKVLVGILATDMEQSNSLAIRMAERAAQVNRSQCSGGGLAGGNVCLGDNQTSALARSGLLGSRAPPALRAVDGKGVVSSKDKGETGDAGEHVNCCGGGDIDLLLCGILHCMDLSNVLTTDPVNRVWMRLICREFNSQTDLERKHKLPVSSSLECRTYSQRVNMQIRFLDFVVLPRWRSLHKITGEFADMVSQGETNLIYWKDTASSNS
eukprot:GHVQ01005955.1.p1 GENE.GHVQ01005955.1~~GHVQ01005955.1.p1  ORF type:complete len:463 (+),score=48.10 GHVQ01005955.1:277-1665(+)